MNKKWVPYVALPFLFTIIVIGIYQIGLRDLLAEQVANVQAAMVKGAPQYSYEQEMEHNEKEADEKSPAIYDQFGKISCERIGLQAPIYYGDSDEILEKGVGVYAGSSLPGKNKTILAGGHDTTYLAPLEQIEKQDCITVMTTYGTFRYEVVETKVAEANDKQAYDPVTDEETLILYTCYPFGKVTSSRTKRYYVYAKKLSGPALQEGTSDEE